MSLVGVDRPDRHAGRVPSIAILIACDSSSDRLCGEPPAATGLANTPRVRAAMEAAEDDAVPLIVEARSRSSGLIPCPRRLKRTSRLEAASDSALDDGVHRLHFVHALGRAHRPPRAATNRSTWRVPRPGRRTRPRACGSRLSRALPTAKPMTSRSTTAASTPKTSARLSRRKSIRDRPSDGGYHSRPVAARSRGLPFHHAWKPRYRWPAEQERQRTARPTAFGRPAARPVPQRRPPPLLRRLWHGSAPPQRREAARSTRPSASAPLTSRQPGRR